MNWYETAFIKRAARVHDIENLRQWNARLSQMMDISTTSLIQLRGILGDISAHMNMISQVFKTGVRSPSQENSAKAQLLIPDVVNFSSLHMQLMQTEKILSGENFAHIQTSTDIGAKNTLKVVNGLVHMLLNANFTPEQQVTFQHIAGNLTEQQNAFADEVNASRMNAFLQNSIYSTKDPSERTVRVVRECLQNAVDAAMEQHRRNPGSKPLVNVDLSPQSDEEGKYIDVVVTDNGIGMDWATLSQKFFVYFASGKENQDMSAGGFGIAKALIQEVPEHGWGIDTNGIHSNRFHKNVYMGTKQNATLQPPRSKIQPNPGGGTSLFLFKLPFIEPYQIESLCQNYATNGIISISVNGKTVVPAFKLDELVNISGNPENLVAAFSGNDVERSVITEVMQTKTQEIEDSMTGLTFDDNGIKTTISFYIKKEDNWGSLYVMMNGQFQFNSDMFSKATLVCNIQTNARPGTEEYPVDAGRENIREPYKGRVEKVVEVLKRMFEEVSKNELFKQGLSIFTINKNQKAMTTGEGSEGSKAMTDLERTNAIAELFPEKKELTPEEFSSRLEGYARSEKTSPPPSPSSSAVEAPSTSVDEQQAAIIKAVAQEIRKDNSSKFDIDEAIQKVLDGLNTPCNVLIQKNFVASDMPKTNPEITVEMAILWQRTLKIVMDAIAPRAKKLARWGFSHKNFVPGLIFSESCLGLYMPPVNKKNPIYTIAINPLTVAATMQPKLFEQKFGNTVESQRDSYEEQKGLYDTLLISKDESENSTNRLASLYFHIAIHELCHLLHPDGWGAENFHNNITVLELMARPVYPQVLKETRGLAEAIRNNSAVLIRTIAKQRKKTKV